MVDKSGFCASKCPEAQSVVHACVYVFLLFSAAYTQVPPRVCHPSLIILSSRRYLLAIPSRERLTRVLARVLDEKQFLSPNGIRSLSQ
jgi:hypothetical protein